MGTLDKMDSTGGALDKNGLYGSLIRQNGPHSPVRQNGLYGSLIKQDGNHPPPPKEKKQTNKKRQTKLT